MPNSGFDLIEKSLEKSLTIRTESITEPSPLELALFRIAKWCLVGTVTSLYLLSHQWHPAFAIPMAILFGYSFTGLAQLILDFVVYVFTNPMLLQEDIDILQKNDIQPLGQVAFIRPIYAKSITDMDTVLRHMRDDVVANHTPQNSMKFILVDDTTDAGIREHAQNRILEMQNEFGSDTVFYFYRNPECDFFNKVGVFQDLVMLLREGWTRPRHYTDDKWKEWVQASRDPQKPIWSEILGDLNALGIRTAKEKILTGQDITLSDKAKIDIAFIADADNEWPAGQPLKIAAKMRHPANSHITIFQPCIEVSNPDETRFIRLNTLARKMYGFDPIAKWRLYRFSPFYGKGAIRLSTYADEVIKKEALHPGKAASHDFQESLYVTSVLVEDAYILERTFSNKLSELLRGSQWLWGDMETVEQYFLKDFSPGRKEHLWMLLRVAIGPLIYALWLVLTIFAWLASTIAHPCLLWTIFLSIATASILIPKFIVPYLERFKPRPYQICRGRQSLAPPEFRLIIREGFAETAVSTLIHSLDLIYRSWAVITNLYQQTTGSQFVWNTGAAGEAKTANISLGDTYRLLWVSPVIALILLFAGCTGLFPTGLTLILLPYALSFLFGPAVVWYTSKALTKQ